MAGSYRHLTDGTSRILRDRDRAIDFEMIENMGDAKECMEELVGMIWHLADGDPDRIEDARQHYKEGLRLAGLNPQG